MAHRPERAVMLVAGMCAALVPLPALVVWARRRGAVPPARLALLALAGAVVVLAGVDLYWLGANTVFPGDYLIWSETEFVQDIIKLRAGYPLYTAQQNNESFIYTPGAQLLTWLLTSLVGRGDSVVAFRAVQLGFVALAALVALLCARRILLLAGRAAPREWVWGALWLPALFLMATNATTNPYVQNLHNDALALLVSVVAYWLLLEYAARREWWVLAAMAVVPAAGFLVKQSLAIWAGLYVVQLLLFDRPRESGARERPLLGAIARSLPRAAAFGVAAFGGVALVVWLCVLRWGGDFVYWTFTVLGAHPVSPLRSVQHVLESWAYFAGGLAAALVLLRGERLRLLLGPWLVWLAFIGAEAYTSGVAWMLNHLGPGCLIAGAWLVAAATTLWRERVEICATRPAGERWLRPLVAASAAVLLLGGLGAIRVPVDPLGRDAYRYHAEIAREFEGVPAESVRLDSGSWPYLASGVVQKDRVTSFGDRGLGEVGDFSGMIRRLRERRYAKILVRNLHSPDFWYDHYLWDRSSGIRAALLASYREVRRIRAVGGDDPMDRPRYLFNDVSILVPRAQ
jgi:hypothetical protein